MEQKKEQKVCGLCSNSEMGICSKEKDEKRLSFWDLPGEITISGIPRRITIWYSKKQWHGCYAPNDIVVGETFEKMYHLLRKKVLNGIS